MCSLWLCDKGKYALLRLDCQGEYVLLWFYDEVNFQSGYEYDGKTVKKWLLIKR